MNCVIVSIGDELILGQIVDTNSAWLSRELAALGVEVSAHVTVGDRQSDIERAIREAGGDEAAGACCDLLLITGGIGPTDDDLTRQALASVINVPLELDEQWLGRIEDYFAKIGREMPATNRIQAMIPRGARRVDNPVGTAAGIHAIIGKCDVFVMPGVPGEMQAMFAQTVVPAVQQRHARGAFRSRTLHTFGVGESAIAQKLGALMRRDRNPSVGTTVSNGIVSVRMTARFTDVTQAERELEATVRRCRQILGDLVFGQEDETLASVVGAMLRGRAMKLATAESCTGGLLAKMLTDVPGSSDYFMKGWITYSNESKTELVGVEPALIERHGAVSEQVVTAMARGALERSGCNVALAITGIAGPTGGTAEKPVGTVCIALASSRLREALDRTFRFVGDRETIRDRSARMALGMLRFHLLAREMPF